MKTKMKQKFERFWEDVLEGKPNWEKSDAAWQLDYIPWRDSEGHVLKPEEILFCNKDTMPNDEIEVFDGNEPEYYNIESPGVELLFDAKVGHFPIALKTKEGTLLYYKFSEKTGELLPYHAGAVPQISIGLKGAPMVGKSLLYLQMTDEEGLHNAIAQDTNVGFKRDLPQKENWQEQESKVREAFRQGILPEENRRGQIMHPSSFLVTRGTGWAQKNIMLEFTDIDGQECIEDASWDGIKYYYNYFFLMISAEDILAAKEGKPLQCKKMLDELAPRLNVFRDREDFKVLVIVTKADLLDQDHLYLKEVFKNTIVTENGVSRQTVHRKAFRKQVFEKKSNSLKRYIQQVSPVFYQNLLHLVPERNLKFSMIASLGMECKETFEVDKIAPFCIDEPLLYVLADHDMYPVTMDDKDAKDYTSADTKQHKTSGFKEKKRRGFISWVLDISGLGDYEEEIAEWDEEILEEWNEKPNKKSANSTKRKYKVYTGKEETKW